MTLPGGMSERGIREAMEDERRARERRPTPECVRLTAGIIFGDEECWCGACEFYTDQDYAELEQAMEREDD